jgi:hypothetical protein
LEQQKQARQDISARYAKSLCARKERQRIFGRNDRQYDNFFGERKKNRDVPFFVFDFL